MHASLCAPERVDEIMAEVRNARTKRGLTIYDDESHKSWPIISSVLKGGEERANTNICVCMVVAAVAEFYCFTIYIAYQFVQAIYH